ncbi:hypothetical protein V6N11_049369 [Hibiscus sabdariffa]|uniref:Uncharacterized protein n=1 Tax=Hibiscus sabdariffa TaxID=183260 RepID=A0ABR2P0D6_9ROSI
MLSRERACQSIRLLGVTRSASRMLVDLGVCRCSRGNASSWIWCYKTRGWQLDPEPLGHEIAEDVFCVLAVAEANAVSIVENLLRILREGNAKSKATAANVF